MSEEGVASRVVGPVHRAFALLQLVVDAEEPVGVRDLARRSGLTKSTTGRMLGILTDLGMVERTAAGEALPGANLASLTSSVGRSASVLRERFRPLAGDLMRQFGENAAIAIDDGDQLLYIASERVESAVQVPDPLGERFDFHLVAPGLIAMAEWPEHRLARYLSRALVAATDHSVVEPDVIRPRLVEVRSSGFVWTNQELDLEVNGVAVPIRDSGRDVIATATLYGPAYRLNPTESPHLGQQLADAVGMSGIGLS